MHKLIATGLITLDTILLLTMPLQAKEVTRNQDCTASIASAQNLIETGRRVEVIVRSLDISEMYPDYPANRPHRYNLLLRGSASESIMNSPKFMKVIAEQIISNCNTVSSVTFGVYSTGWSYSIGLMSGEKIDLFECLEREGANGKLKWGQEYCSL